MVTDRNYWATYRDSIADWYGEFPPPGKLGVERVFEFARYILETAEREQVLRIIFVPGQSAPREGDVPSWLELVRAKFEEEGRLRLFPGWGAEEWLGGQLRELARLAYYQGERIVEEDIEDVGDLEKSVVAARGGDPDGIRFTRPIMLDGWSYNEPDQPLIPGRPPTRETSFSLSLYTDLWFPRVIGFRVGDDAGRDPEIRHPARGRDGLMDNSRAGGAPHASSQPRHRDPPRCHPRARRHMEARPKRRTGRVPSGAPQRRHPPRPPGRQRVVPASGAPHHLNSPGASAHRGVYTRAA